MMGRWRGLIWLAALGAGCAPVPGGGVAVDSAAVTVTVQPDGSVDVEEALQVRRADQGPPRFVRRIRADYIDRIEGVAATLDGRPAEEAGGSIGLLRSGDLLAIWPIERVDSQQIELRYRLHGVQFVRGPRTTLVWPVLPASRGFPVPDARVTLTVPPGTIFVSGPSVLGHDAVVSPGADGIAAVLRGVDATSHVVLYAEMVPGSGPVAEPAWQYNRARGWQIMPAFLAAGLCLVAVAGAVLLMVRRQYPRYQPVEAHSPAEQPPLIVAALLRGRVKCAAAWRLALLVDLAQRGDLALRELPGTRSGRSGALSTLLLHETAALEAIQRPGASQPLALGGALMVLGRERRAIEAALEADLIAAGMLDAERVGVARGLWVAGVVTAVLGVLSVIVLDLTLSRFGYWPQFMSGGLIVSGGLFAAGSVRAPLLTRAGAAAQAGWRAEVRRRRDAARRRAVAAADVDRGLPVALACGFATAWLRAASSTTALITAVRAQRRGGQ